MESGICLKSVDGIHQYEWVDGNSFCDEYKCKLCGDIHIEEDALGG